MPKYHKIAYVLIFLAVHDQGNTKSITGHFSYMRKLRKLKKSSSTSATSAELIPAAWGFLGLRGNFLTLLIQQMKMRDVKTNSETPGTVKQEVWVTLPSLSHSVTL